MYLLDTFITRSCGGKGLNVNSRRGVYTSQKERPEKRNKNGCAVALDSLASLASYIESS